MRYQLYLLLLASCIFYAAYVPVYLFILLLLIVIDYVAGIAIEDATETWKSRYLILSILANLGLLGFFKYSNFAIENVVAVIRFFGCNPQVIPHMPWLIPLGLSFHTFQSMAYTIEVREGKQRAERNFFFYALYVMFFPQLAAGPIERPQHMLPQLHVGRRFDQVKVVRGLQLMLWGAIKKIAIADRLGPMVDQAYGHQGDYSGAVMIFATVCFAIQIYCDFSGYTDIARGCAEVMGYELTENFSRPYFARNLQEYWRRWHISLGSWLRDYVFYPLRFVLPANGLIYSATLIVFFLVGLWHGAGWNFIVFGLIHGVGFSLSALWTMRVARMKKRGSVMPASSIWRAFEPAMGIFSTFSFVCFALIFFRAANLETANSIVSKSFYWLALALSGHAKLTSPDLDWFELNVNDIFWGAVLSAALFTCEWLQDSWSLRQHANKYNKPTRWALYYVGLMIIGLLGKFETRPFIYFQF